ncbi:MAG: NUDIX hydrolase [Candidatus Micrarchaeota archaeon]|nr:NUDIX hydrolase [Candidatus Micrarchaeota archaeon]
MASSQIIPKKIYKVVLKMVPIFCVDAIIKTERGVLLGIRNNEPVKNKPWFIGGRVFYDEPLEKAILRKVKEETGLKVKIEKLVGTYACIFHKGERRHTICATYVVKKVGGKLSSDDQHSGFVYIKNVNRHLPKYVREILLESGVFRQKKSPPKYGGWTMVVD